MSSLREKWNGLPRAAKWGAWAVLGLVAYFGVIEPVIDYRNEVERRATTAEGKLRSLVRESAGVKDDENTLREGVLAFGEVSFPADSAQGAVAFNRLISEVLSKHGVKNNTSTSRTSPIGSGPLSKLVGEDLRLERLSADLQFDAEPEAVAGVIADLERSPAVTAVSRVQIRRADSRDADPRAVRATISVETWLTSPKARRP